MQHIDDDLLYWFRCAQRCEWCRVPSRGGFQPHHIFARGMGGGSRLDIPINLVSLCYRCHRRHHDGDVPLSEDLLAVVAAREGLLQPAIVAAIKRLLRADRARKLCKPCNGVGCQCCAGLGHVGYMWPSGGDVTT